jgi:fibronectin type 3 domain-containing protein
MRSITLPTPLQPIQVFIEKIEALQYDNVNTVNIGAGGNATAYPVAVTDATDAAAMLQQINNAINSTAISTFITGNPVPTTAPVAPVATPDYGQTKITWNQMASNYAFRVYRSEASGSGYAAIGDTNVNSFLDQNITPGVTYYYVVTTYTARGESGYSTEVNGASLIPAVPAGLLATADLYQSDLTWGAVTAAGSAAFTDADVAYEIYRDGNSLTASDPTSYNDSALTAGQSYSYTVAAVINGVSSAQSVASACTPTALAAPAGMVASSGIYSADISWSAVAGALGYNVYRSVVSGTGYVMVSQSATPGFTDTYLRSDTVYYYVVTATVNGGESVVSTESSCQPTTVTINAASPNPASISGSTITFTGTGFDPSQQALLKYGTVQIAYLQVVYLDATHFTVITPGGLSAGDVQFYYEVNGSDYTIPFLVAFQ